MNGVQSSQKHFRKITGLFSFLAAMLQVTQLAGFAVPVTFTVLGCRLREKRNYTFNSS